MALDKTKTNPDLGKRISKVLREHNLETPYISMLGWDHHRLVEATERSFREIVTNLGLDLRDDSLQDTPGRLAKMFHNELTWGLDYRNFPKCTAVDNKIGYDEMVIETGITVKSLCEHHFQSIYGTAAVAYIPNKKVLGLSKMNRIVDYFSRRPQIQERLTAQICVAMQEILETDDVAVSINAEHGCVKMRGIEDQHSRTTTNKLSGAFKNNPETRAEFINLIA